MAAANYYKLINRNKSICLISLSVLIGAISKDKEILALVVLLISFLYYQRKTDFFRIKGLIQLFERLLANPISKLMAELSYGVYLIHLLIMIPLGGGLLRIPAYMNSPDKLRFLILFIATAVPAYLISWFLYLF